VVVELDHGVMVYPPGAEGEPWRAVWVENGQRRYRQGTTEEKLAAKLEKITERLEADAPDMERPGADLIAYYLSPDRLPADKRWSRKHAHTQRRLCERFAGPVIDTVTCQDIKTWHMQQIVNAAPTPGEGRRVRGTISALVSAGIEGGYLANPRLAKVPWQAGQRQANNALIFPGLGLGVTVSRAPRVSDGMLAVAADALADLSGAAAPGAPLLPRSPACATCPPPPRSPSPAPHKPRA
jgi:hypothetical protein